MKTTERAKGYIRLSEDLIVQPAGWKNLKASPLLMFINKVADSLYMDEKKILIQVLTAGV